MVDALFVVLGCLDLELARAMALRKWGPLSDGSVRVFNLHVIA
jgi:hypothetical protein